ncbi:hypothetical protein HPP92_023120 [Vanilla planifolia]|uniref:starch synthase n=1 Tax=Vanilla planifolia TaxID=51239 RepID=A0A835PYU4_VANPL|nr:hypothetical protein HPP92_023120 [Vanilla planifolia]
MAAQACALVLGPNCYFPGLKRALAPPVSCTYRRTLCIYSKMPYKKLRSSSPKICQNKKKFGHSSLNTNIQNHANESKDVQDASSENPSIPFEAKVSDAEDNQDLPTAADDIKSSVGKNSIEKLQAEVPNDLMGLVDYTQKNVTLPNQAQINTFDELDQIISDKEALQAEINSLEVKLAETNARLKVAAEEKVHLEVLEREHGRLKHEMYLRNRFDGKMGTSDSITHDVIDLAIVEELSGLREENQSLKDDIRSLNEKLNDVENMRERISMLEKERSFLESSVKELKSELEAAHIDFSELSSVKLECKSLWDKQESLCSMFDTATEQTKQAVAFIEQSLELHTKVEKLEASLEQANVYKLPEMYQQNNEILQQNINLLEERLEIANQKILSLTQSYPLEEFERAIENLKENDDNSIGAVGKVDDMPWSFWSRLLLMVDGWMLEKKISISDATLLREMAWKKDHQIYRAYLACNGKNDDEVLAAFLKLTQPQNCQGLHVVHIAAEMAPVAKVGGLGDVVSGLSKALQRKGHLVEIVLPKYDCLQDDHISDLKILDVAMESYFDGQLFRNKIWVGIVEGLPVYFIEPHHPSNFFWRGKVYGEHDDFKRFSFFCRAALELLYQAGKKPDIIHCHDWQTAFVAPLYWDIYANKGFNSARICFTCHNFEYQGTTHVSELSSCGLDIVRLNRPDRMQDNFAHDRINPLKGGIVFSNIVTTVSPTYAQEARTAEGGRGLHGTLNIHSKKFVGILNGIDTDSWNPSTDTFLPAQYSADDLHGKEENKDALRLHLGLSSAQAFKPLVGCITRLVPQKGVHLIRHAIYQTLELGGQFVLLGFSPVAHIQREFEGIANHFKDHPDVRLLLKYDDALSHIIYAASDMFIIPSIFEPCGLTQMIAMRYGSVPIVRRTGGLNDSVFDVDDDSIPQQYKNGFSFWSPNELELNNAMERAFNYYSRTPGNWKKLVKKIMTLDFSWETSAAQYEELYVKAVAKARAATSHV